MARLLAAMNATIEEPIAWTVALVAADPSPFLPSLIDGASSFFANATGNFFLFAPTVTLDKIAYIAWSTRSGVTFVFALMVAACELATAALAARKLSRRSVAGPAGGQAGAPEHESLLATMTR